MKKTLCLLLVFIGLFSMASAEPLETDLQFELETPSYLLMEQETGQVILEHNADERRPVASVTKLMTLLLIFEALEAGSISLNDQVVCSPQAAGMDGSQALLDAGSTYKLNNYCKR